MSSAANGRVRVSLPSSGHVGRLLGLGLLVAGGPLHAKDLGRSSSSLADCDVRADAAHRTGAVDTCYFELGSSWPRGFGPVHDHLMRRLRAHPGDVGARLWAGFFAHKLGRLAEAEEFLEAAAEAFGTQGPPEGEVLARSELAILLCYAGRDAATNLGRIEGLAAGELGAEARARAFSALAACARKAHDHGRAITMFQEARQVLSTLDPSFFTEQLTQEVLDGLGSSYGDSGRHRESWAVFLEQARRPPRNVFQLAVLKHRLASESVLVADRGQGSWEETEQRIRDSLDMERLLPEPDWPPNATRLVDAALHGPSPRSLAELDEAESFWRTRSFWGVAVALRLKAKFAADLDPSHPAAALAIVDRALRLTAEAGNRWEEGMTRLTRAYVHRRAGQAKEALADAMGAVDELDAVRDAQIDSIEGAWTAAESSFTYELVSGWLVDAVRGGQQPADLEIPFALLERHRARALREALSTARIPLLPTGGELGRQRAEVLGELARLESTLRSSSLTSDVRSRTLRDLARAQQAEAIIRTELEQRAPRRLLIDDSVPSLISLQRALGEDQALLSFQTWRLQHFHDATYADGSSWLTLVWKDGARAFRIPDADALEPRIEFFRALIASRDGSDLAGAVALQRDLLGPALRALGDRRVRRLVIVPDGPLHQLPFEALRDQGGEPLGQRYAISLVPSAALWLAWHAGGGRGGAGADPQAWVLAAPRVPPRIPGLPDLPFASVEARSISVALGPRARVYLDDAASEHLLKSARLDDVRVLHFAAHAVVDEAQPERSAVVLAPGSPEEDGRLEMREVADLDLTGRLVVLASCRTASGAIVSGEGPLSLARAFFQAGSSSVVGSVLAVRDADSAALMEDVYRGLAGGLSISRAVQEARARLIRAGAVTAAWAGPAVFGDGDFTPFPARGSARWVPIAWLGAAVLGAASCCFLLVRRARTRHRPASAGSDTSTSSLPPG